MSSASKPYKASNLQFSLWQLSEFLRNFPSVGQTIKG